MQTQRNELSIGLYISSPLCDDDPCSMVAAEGKCIGTPLLFIPLAAFSKKKTAKRDGYDISHEEEEEEVDSQRVCFCYDVSLYAM